MGDALRLLEALKACLKADTASAGSSPSTARKVPAASEQLSLEQEDNLLNQFALANESIRDFSGPKYIELLEALLVTRIFNDIWLGSATQPSLLKSVTVLRILLRSQFILQHISGEQLLHFVSSKLTGLTKDYYSSTIKPLTPQLVAELVSIVDKLTLDASLRPLIASLGIHKNLVLLLSSSHSPILHGALHALVRLARSTDVREQIADFNCTETLLRILQDYHADAKCLAGELLNQLSALDTVTEEIKVFCGIPLLVGLLSSSDQQLLPSVLGTIAECAQESVEEIRSLGAVPLLLSLLTSKEPASASRSDFLVFAACCACITKLALDDSVALDIRERNGIFLIANFLLYTATDSEARKAVDNLQANAFRALRFLFSVERNRQLFKRLFPADLFEIFIDVGHYQPELAAYYVMVKYLKDMTTRQRSAFSTAIRDTDLNKPPSKIVKNYAFLEILGAGSFGCVYRARKDGQQTNYAVKEIPLRNAMLFGSSEREHEEAFQRIHNEVQIIERLARHPNIVRYYKTFTQENNLYIVMEMVEGASLQDHFNSMSEKHITMDEQRIWNIFIQLCMGIRYIHKEKKIAHRDLTPANIMLGWNDQVKITDFGLSKQFSELSFMKSNVGTLLYSCPEIVKNEPYGEQADIWAIGCILYQMASMKPPFMSSNMLTLAKRIVEADYEALPANTFSDDLIKTVQYCLQPDGALRPDIIQVCSVISSRIMRALDDSHVQAFDLEKQLEKEKGKAFRRHADAALNRENYQRLFQAQEHERSEKKMSTQSSASSLMQSRGHSHGLVVPFTPTKPVSPPTRDQQRLRMLHLKRYVSSTLNNDEEGPFPSPININSPSPMMQQSISMSNTNNIVNNSVFANSGRDVFIETSTRPSRSNSIESSAGLRSLKPRSGQVGKIVISPRKVREIDDPVTQLLNTLHKIIYITQLPPELERNESRHVIEKYKRALFSQQSTSFNLKQELRKLLMGAKEVIDLNFGHGVTELQLFIDEKSEVMLTTVTTSEDSDAMRDIIRTYAKEAKEEAPKEEATTTPSERLQHSLTYEQLQKIIERVLLNSGYYNVNQSSGRTRSLPVVPPQLKRGATTKL